MWLLAILLMMRRFLALIAIALLASAPALADETSHPHAAPSSTAGPEPLFEGLGNVHHPVTTKSRLAQKYFDQGLAFYYGFNDDEAYQSFLAAAALDPKLAMADWGVALVLGPNYNLPGNDQRMKIAYGAIQRARSLEKFASPEEKALIEALAKRYGPDGKQTPEREMAYADAMREVAHQYPNASDVQVLFAESLMDLHPWELWSADGKPGPQTLELVATLERTLKKHPDHLGANHYYIHAVEASPHPERALRSAERLATMAPMQGHLVHMPSHVYIRVGRYHDASNANEAAIKADRYFLAQSHETGAYPAMYAIHNIDFLLYGEMMEGRKRDSLQTARELKDAVPFEVVKAMPMAELMWPKLYFAMARFGAWDEILAEPAPPKVLAYTTAMWHYARGLAFAAKGKPGDAALERKDLDTSAAAVSAQFMIGPSNNAPGIARLASQILGGAIASARGDHEQALADYTEAVRMQDALGYDEPPSWYYPVRENLGAELLASKQPALAEAVYRADLKRNPENPRSLFGLAQSLRAQGKTPEAAKVEERFTKAWAHADVTLAPDCLAAQ
jgi:tetratricopeptide (TPR) repeat protein